MPIVKCEICKKEVFKRDRDMKTCKHHYCSMKCFRKAKAKQKEQHKIKTNCSFCGDDIYRYPSQIKDVNYCCNKCRTLASRKHNKFIIKENYAEMITYDKDEKVIVLIDKDDIEKIKEFYWFPRYDSVLGSYYINSRTGKRGTSLILHRLIMNTPKGMVTDHINRNTLDNRKCNLRICTQCENAVNTKLKCTNTSGYKNIHFDKRRGNWVLSITRNKIKKEIARSKNIEDLIKIKKEYLKDEKINGEQERVK